MNNLLLSVNSLLLCKKIVSMEKAWVLRILTRGNYLFLLKQVT